MMCVRSFYGASKVGQFRPRLLFVAAKLVLHRATPRIYSDLHVERCTPGRLFEIGISRYVLHISSGGHAFRPREYSYRILPAFVCYCCCCAPSYTCHPTCYVFLSYIYTAHLLFFSITNERLVHPLVVPSLYCGLLSTFLGRYGYVQYQAPVAPVG